MIKRKQEMEKTFYQYLWQNTLPVPKILLEYYQEMSLQQTELVLLLQILAAKPKEQDEFSFSELKNYLRQPEAEWLPLWQSLLQKGVVKETAQGYNLAGLYDMMWECWAYLQSVAQRQDQQQGGEQKALAVVYSAFENNFARPLSPIEGEKIIGWLEQDGYKQELILEALSRAVLYGKCNFVYIERILERWQKEGLHTLSQVKAQEEQKNAKAVGGNKIKSAKSHKKTKSIYSQAYDKNTEEF